MAPTELGTRIVDYTERDPILYALPVGTAPCDLDLAYEQRLRVLPTFALTVARWAPDELGSLRAIDTGNALNGAQHLCAGVVADEWFGDDARARGRGRGKGTAAIFDVAVGSEYFVATWSIFAPAILRLVANAGVHPADLVELAGRR